MAEDSMEMGEGSQTVENAADQVTFIRLQPTLNREARCVKREA